MHRARVPCGQTQGREEVGSCPCCVPPRPAARPAADKDIGSKHTGLEKAVYQIEQALRRSSAGAEQIQSPEHASELRYLLHRSRQLLGDPGFSSHGLAAQPHTHEQELSPHQTPVSLETTRSPPEDLPDPKAEKDHLNLDDAENPLQLLARSTLR